MVYKSSFEDAFAQKTKAHELSRQVTSNSKLPSIHRTKKHQHTSPHPSSAPRLSFPAFSRLPTRTSNPPSKRVFPIPTRPFIPIASSKCPLQASSIQMRRMQGSGVVYICVRRSRSGLSVYATRVGVGRQRVFFEKKKAVGERRIMGCWCRCCFCFEFESGMGMLSERLWREKGE